MKVVVELRRALYIVSALLLLIFVNVQAAFAASPVAVLKSARNASTYQDQHIGTFEDDFKVFKLSLIHI